MIRRKLYAGLCLAFTLGLATQVAVAEGKLDQISEVRRTPVVRAIQRAVESTVNIHSEKRARTGDAVYPVGKKVNGMGTGVILDERGYIVTNYHVVQDVDLLQVTLHDHSTYTARVVSFDAAKDLAIIKISATSPLVVMPVGTSSDIMLGESVLAIGNAFGYPDTVTQGIVSAMGRDVEVNDEQAYQNLIQTDAAINPGNSGGPLINLEGDVIGINVAIRAGAQKIGFAIPIDDARVVIARLMSVERHASTFHGIETRDEKQGANRKLIVQSVAPNSPAAEIGLQAGDIITKVDSVPVVDRVDLERVLLRKAAGEKVALEFTRKDEVQDTSLTMARMAGSRNLAGKASIQQPQIPVPPPISSSAKAADDKTWTVLGLRIKKMDASQRIFQGQAYHGGLLVTDVRSGSPAAQNGIRNGDVLVGLHVWETVSDENVDYVLNHPNFSTFSPLKFYILRESETLYGHFSLAAN
ncbi:MAG: trypsin-like peptidase domain-containing protein [Planctomycetaceae bacterium]